jgi:soluble lytic murein transglycosylase-like protein
VDKALYLGILTVAVAAVLVATTAAAASPPPLAGWTASDLRYLVQKISVEHGLDPDLVDALVRVESGYNPRAVSKKGAMGLMQLMPETARRLRVRDPFDPEQNVDGGVREFARLIARYSGSLDLALAAYNAGEGAVARYGGIPPYRETRDYVAAIMTMYTGEPYRFSSRRYRPPVRLVRGTGGEMVISNYSASEQRAAASGAGAPVLGGGFGTRR